MYTIKGNSKAKFATTTAIAAPLENENVGLCQCTHTCIQAHTYKHTHARTTYTVCTHSIFSHTLTHISTHTHTHTHTHLRTHARMHARTNPYTNTHKYKKTQTYAYSISSPTTNRSNAKLAILATLLMMPVTTVGFTIP